MGKSQVGLVLHDTYRLERLIGEGSMGAVYEASHLRLRRRFAVKLLLPSAAAPAESMARFRREAEITSELGHPNIVEVVDFNRTDDGATYIVMEHLEGEDLGTRIRRGALELAEAESILRQAASGLQAAHELGVVHRDLKPQNLFLARRRDEVVVKVLDFGISKVLSSQSRMTRAETLMGTPSYMAPELATGNAVDATPRTDIFGLAAIAFEMLAGQPPYVGVSVLAVLYKVVHEPTPSVRSLCPSVPAAVDAVLQQAMAKDPAERFTSMDELADAFSRALGATAIERSASPAATAERPIAASLASPGPVVPTGAIRPPAVLQTGPGHAPAPPPTLASHTGSTLSASVGELSANAALRPRRRWLLALAAGIVLVGGGAAVLLLGAKPQDAGSGSGHATVAPRPDAAPPRSDLARLAAAPARRDSAPSPAAAPDLARIASLDAGAPDRGPAPRVIRPPRPGRLRVACPDGVAKVYVDGKLVGTTGPVWEGVVPSGVRTVAVELGGQTRRERVPVAAGKLVKVKLSLRRGR
jgi:serine/threonine-protein kinase